MIGELKLEEVQKDIDAAKKIGLNGFALNFGRLTLGTKLLYQRRLPNHD